MCGLGAPRTDNYIILYRIAGGVVEYMEALEKGSKIASVTYKAMGASDARVRASQRRKSYRMHIYSYIYNKLMKCVVCFDLCRKAGRCFDVAVRGRRGRASNVKFICAMSFWCLLYTQVEHARPDGGMRGCIW